jgi:hypothetical protein
MKHKSFVQYLVERLSITLPKQNLGIRRKDMPQIKSDYIEDFLKYMKSEGVLVRRIMIPVDRIKATQKEINTQKILKLMHDEAENHLNKPIIISKDNYLLDGHHRWLALWNKFDDYKLVAHQANVYIRDLLELASGFSKVAFKRVNEENANI